MFRTAVLLVALTAATAARADDAAVAKTLTDLGGQVTLKDGRAVKVGFRDCSKLGDAEFRLIGSLTGLKELVLYGSCKGLDDTTLPHLSKLTALEVLGTDGIRVSDDGYKHFAPLKSLKQLSLFHPAYGVKGFTGKGLAHLKDLPALRRLTFAGASAGDEAMVAAAELKQLRELSVWHIHSTPAVADVLAGMTHLTSLKWGQRLRRWDGGSNAPDLTDAMVAKLARLPALESLALDEARLSADGLRVLKGHAKLKKLTLTRIDIPAADVEKLKSDLPGVTVSFAAMTAEDVKKLDAMLADPPKRTPAPPKPAAKPVEPATPKRAAP